MSKNKNVDIFRNKRDILYPIFTECVKFTTDEFWKALFLDLSIGKCPKSLYICNNTIYASNKKKNFSYIIPTDKDAGEVFTELRHLLMKNVSICSSIDINTKKEEIKGRENDDTITNSTTWADIRKKNLRELFIVKFVVQMRKQYKLSWDASRHLYSLIQLSLIYKTQSSKDIIFNNRKIERIEGIEYDEDKKIFINKFEDNDTTEEEETDNGDKYLYYYWDRYISYMSRHI